ncbi:High-affinity leucine-specific transportsystem periplasmic binding protein LivK [Lactiplantibacillus plantarum]|uniref:ABC transporter substrate-binding protein n=1 Tax=Lactiplantibacillus plantarum TaxID=1590 RepID=UPI0007C3FE43|nr:ABC transporter substrate-binding protein [Lactiplantibacillus plantarum]KZU07453.1 High-affinity leucine-specific transportsystem periplasmic binding protein LivK [Lactiplantibacillus plantarum]WNJ66897.1 ABC transporter substrate-binding protein [Lactiplantibacillus plantarum]
MKKWEKQTMKIAALGAMALTLAGCATAKSSSSQGNNPGKTIKIGVNMELSGSAAGYGEQQKQGIQLAVKKINKSGGIKVGGTKKKIQLVIRDNKTSNTIAASVAAQLVNNDKVVAVVGPATTSAGTAAIPNMTKAAVPSVSPSATDPDYTLQKSGKVQKYIFRACYQNNFQGATAATFVTKNLKAKRVAILTDNSSDYGTGLTKAFKKQYRGTVVSSQTFQEGDKDFNAILTALKHKKIDAIYAPGYYSEIGLIVKQARQAGIKAPIVGSDGMVDAKLAQIAGKSNATNVYYTTPFSTKASATNKVASKFMSAYKAKYGSTAPTFSALAYDSVYMIKAAIEKEGSANSVKIADGLAKLKNFKSVTGTTTIDKQHNPEKTISIEQLTNGVVSKVYNVK